MLRSPPLTVAPPGGRASGASEATREVLGIIIGFLDFNLDFLGFPFLLLGFLRIS